MATASQLQDGGIVLRFPSNLIPSNIIGVEIKNNLPTSSNSIIKTNRSSNKSLEIKIPISELQWNSNENNYSIDIIGYSDTNFSTEVFSSDGNLLNIPQLGNGFWYYFTFPMS